MKRPSARRVTPRRSDPTTVDEYFARAKEPGRTVLTKLRAAIRSVLPRDATDIISYQIPAFKGDGAGVSVWYAAFADHVSLFPGGSVVAKFKDELTGFKTSKGTVQSPLDKSLPTASITYFACLARCHLRICGNICRT